MYVVFDEGGDHTSHIWRRPSTLSRCKSVKSDGPMFSFEETKKTVEPWGFVLSYERLQS